MSVSAVATPRVAVPVGRTLLIAVAAVAAVALLIWLVTLAFSGIEPPKPPPKNPFGVGPREAGAPTNAFYAWIMAQQSAFYRSMTAALAALKSGAEGWSGLLWLGFLYGVFHAAGPG
ncbi:MAG: nickel transporter, partial [Beijerinckiaceae bacterium]